MSRNDLRLVERLYLRQPSLVSFLDNKNTHTSFLLTRDISSRGAYFFHDGTQIATGRVKALLLLEIPAFDALAQIMYLSVAGDITRQEQNGFVVQFDNEYVLAPLITVSMETPPQ
jgi:hypothetical protein